MELELLLKLNDRMSRGLKSALTSSDRETKSLRGNLEGVARAADRIRPTGIQRMTTAILQLRKGAQGALDVLNKTAQVGASIAAGGYVLKAAAQKPMDFDRQLALTANVAYSDRDATGRTAGKAQLEAAVRKAQAAGLGSQEQLAETLNQLVGSGAMGSVKNSIDMLPTLAKAGTGTGTDTTDLAKLAIAAKQNMGLNDAETKQFLSKAITAGNLGGFELKDMAKYLPQQMALYSANGMKGMRGSEDLLAYNQAARITAGTSDEAGNNLINLLAKINSSDTQKDFKKQGIDLTGSLANARGNGVSTLDAFLALVERVASKDKSYQSLKERAKNESGDQQKETFQAMAAIMEQKGIGLTVQDRQAMSALLAARQQSGKIREVRAGMAADNGGQIDANYSVVNATASASAERLANTKDRAASDLMSDSSGPLKRLLDGMNNVAAAHPALAKAAYAAATALGVIAAFSGVSGIFGKLKGAAGVAPAAATVAARTSLGASLGMGATGTTAGAAGAVPLLAVTGLAAYGMKKGADSLRDRFKNMPQYSDEASMSAFSLIGKKNPWREVKVVVEVKNGNVLASVNKENSRQAGRH
ncbi:MAG TPA: phage tail tape measure protein [Methylophilaceae bacterium]|nr:phage tail tape measure protein [Methylophilaceae bacterium]